MSNAVDGRRRCQHCRSVVDLASGVKLAIERDGEERTWAFCEDCADSECRHCGGLTPVRTLVATDIERKATGRHVACDRCGDGAPVKNAVELRHPDDPEYQKRVCGDCFRGITVPPEDTVVRDF